MLNAFTLMEAVSNSRYVSTANLTPHEFIGTMEEAVGEHNYAIMTEAADILGFITASDEIMVEAAMNNPSRVDVLMENVFTTIKDKIVKFFEKLIKMAKGMVAKIKAFFYKLTGKTDKWLSIMKPKVEEAKRNSGTKDLSMEMHKWDIAYVTKGLSDGYKAIHIENEDTLKNLPNMQIKKYGDVSKYNGQDANSDDTTKVVEDFAAKEKRLDESIEKVKKEFPGKVAASLGVSGSTTLDSVWQAVTKKATGGEKVEVKFVSGEGQVNVDNMLKALEDYKQGLKDLQKGYEEHIDNLGKTRKEIEDIFKNFEFGENTAPASIVSAVRSYLNKLSTSITQKYSMRESAGSTLSGMNTKFMKEMAFEFMSALSKFAGTKDKKPE